MNAFVIFSAWCAFYGFCIGVCAGAWYDILRVCRIARSKARYGVRRKETVLQGYFDLPQKQRFWSVQTVLIALEDIFFLMVLGIAIAILTFYENDGVFRFYALLACVMGFFCYRVTLGAQVVKLADVIIAKIKAFLRFVVAHTVTPLRRKIKALTRWLKRKLYYRYVKKRTQRVLSHTQQNLSPFFEGKVRKRKTKEAE